MLVGVIFADISDAGTVSIVTGCVTVFTMFFAWLTLWLKLKYGEEKVVKNTEEVVKNTQKVEQNTEKLDQNTEKLDQNTQLTVEAKQAAEVFKGHSDACTAEITALSKTSLEHHARIQALEVQVSAMKVTIEAVDKNLSSTRHEMRGHLQAVMNKLDILAATGGTKAPNQ